MVGPAVALGPMSLQLIKELLYGWRYEAQRGYRFAEYYTLATNFAQARARWWELDLRGAYIWLFTEPLPAFRAREMGADVRLSLFRDAPMRLEPIGRLYHGGRQYNYYRYLEDRTRWRDSVYYCFSHKAHFPHAPRPPYIFTWSGPKPLKDVHVVEEENLADFVLEHRLRHFGCISERDMFKYGALIAIGASGQGMEWHMSATMGLAYALLADVYHGGGHVGRAALARTRAPTAVLVDSIQAARAAPPHRPDALEYKFFACHDAKTSVLGLVGRRCEADRWQDYRIWILQEDMGILGWARFWRAVSGLVDLGRWADAPQFQLLKSLAARGAPSGRLLPLHKILPKKARRTLKNTRV